MRAPRPAAERRAREAAEITALEARIASESPPPSSSAGASPASTPLAATATEFSQLPLSRLTLAGLSRAGFTQLTAIQRAAIPHALAGRDVLGAARTGSGKTLAFLVPLLERLFRQRWAAGDGLGALVISPTRELAAQIFEVLRAVGARHFALSAGLLTGGKDFAEEAAAVSQLAVLVCTPGRLLQHLEQTAALDASQLQLLVLDEADRLLDMGFERTLNDILAYLPSAPQRQTLLFSATQTRSVRDLARLSLAPRPEFVAAAGAVAAAGVVAAASLGAIAGAGAEAAGGAAGDESALSATPARLSQHYVVCRLQDKLSLLYSFVRSHLHSKTLVFLSSCKQSRFVFEAFRRLRPGVPLQLLHGKMRQERRTLVYADFCKKTECVLFATDVVARGLDFPGIDWVLQVDCPEDAQTYIHRVGRTARFRSAGHALLMLLPSEAPGFLRELSAARVPVAETRIAANAAVSVTGKLAAEVAADAELKAMAQKALSSYARSIHLQPNRSVFRPVAELPLKEFGESLGLAVVPEVKLAGLAKAAAGSAEFDAGAIDGADAELASRLRGQAHALKNQNKSLLRLKAKIAEERKARKQLKQQQQQQSGRYPTEGGTDDSGEEDEDDDEEEGVEDGDGDEDAAASRTNGGGGDDDSGDIGGGVLTLRLRQRHVDGAEEAGASAPPPVSASQLASLSVHERARVRRIERDTIAIGAGHSSAAAATATAAGGLTPFQRLAAGNRPAPLSAETITAAAAAHGARVAERLAAAAARDKELERERVRAKRREAKARSAGSDDEEGGDGSQLGDGDDGEEGEVESEEPAAPALRQRVKSHRDEAVGRDAGSPGGGIAEMEAIAHALIGARAKRAKV